MHCTVGVVHRRCSSLLSRFVFVRKYVGADWTVHKPYVKDNEAIQSRGLSCETKTERLTPFTFSHLN